MGKIGFLMDVGFEWDGRIEEDIWEEYSGFIRVNFGERCVWYGDSNF